MARYSSSNLPQLSLAPHFTKKAAELLMDFANMYPEDLHRFDQKWYAHVAKAWSEDIQNMVEAQRMVRAVWEEKSAGAEQVIDLGLGITVPRKDYDPRYFDSSIALFHVSWEYGCIWASPRDLNDYIWLSLLQYSKQLALCANKENGCPTPYFIRKKPNQKFCSDTCAGPAQRAFKRKWWDEHGNEWREKRLKRLKRTRHTKRSTKGGH